MKKVLKIVLSIILVIWIASEIFNFINYREIKNMEIRGAFKRSYVYVPSVVKLFYDLFPTLDKSKAPNLCSILRSFRDTETGKCTVLTTCGTPASKYVVDSNCKI